jgi:hypothetical protein
MDEGRLLLAFERRDARNVAKRAPTAKIFRYAIARGIAGRNSAPDFKPRVVLAEARTENRAGFDDLDGRYRRKSDKHLMADAFEVLRAPCSPSCFLMKT